MEQRISSDIRIGSNHGRRKLCAISRGEKCSVIYDVNTKIEYTASEDGTFSMLYDTDGNPLIYNSNEQNEETK